jgi:ABC-type glycerol-3-phosphate transport system substrate-binding protein
MKRLTWIVLLILPVCGGLLFAGGEAEQGIKLQFASWMVAEASGGEVWIPERITAWEQSHPNVKVEVIPVAWEDTPTKYTLQIQGGTAPDVFTIESLWLGKFAKMPKATADLKKYMDSAFTSQLVPAYKGGEMDGKMAGLVWNPNPWVLVFNKALAARAGVDGAPKTAAEVYAQAQAIKKTGPFGLGIQLSIDEYAADTFHILTWPDGGDLLDAKMKPAASTPGTVKTVKLVKSLVDQGVLPFGEEVRNLRTLFAQDRIGFFFEGPWIAGVLDGEGMSRDAWQVSPWPGDVQPASHILCLTEQSKHKDLAWDLMKFIVTDETTTKEYFKRTGLLPLVAKQYEDPQYDSRYVKSFLTAMSRMRNPNVWASQKKFEIETAFMEGLQKILLNQGAVEATLQEVDAKFAQLLAE